MIWNLSSWRIMHQVTTLGTPTQNVERKVLQNLIGQQISYKTDLVFHEMSNATRRGSENVTSISRMRELQEEWDHVTIEEITEEISRLPTVIQRCKPLPWVARCFYPLTRFYDFMSFMWSNIRVFCISRVIKNSGVCRGRPHSF